MKDAAKIEEGHFLQAHRPRKTQRNDGRRSGTAAGPPDVDRGDSLDTTDSVLKKFLAEQCFAIQFSKFFKLELQIGQKNDEKEMRCVDLQFSNESSPYFFSAFRHFSNIQ